MVARPISSTGLEGGPAQYFMSGRCSGLRSRVPNAANYRAVAAYMHAYTVWQGCHQSAQLRAERNRVTETFDFRVAPRHARAHHSGKLSGISFPSQAAPQRVQGCVS